MAKDDPTLTKIGITSLSAMVAETTTFPIDITKTRLQLYGKSVSSTRPTNAFRVASEILQNQGFLGLYKGLSPAIVRHMFYTPIRIVGYEHMRNAVPDDSILGKALIGGTSGVIAQGQNFSYSVLSKIRICIWHTSCRAFFLWLKSLMWRLKVIASPADLVKVRMQADGRLVSKGLQPRYTGSFDALSKIVQKEGLRGLWQGVVPNIQRAFLVNMGELACYDQAKHLIIQKQICEDNIYAHTLASTMSGLSATALSCPADVVKTRMMNQVAGGKEVLYRNSYDCLVKTVRVEGLSALWKGFFPTWARLGPWQFVFWVSYEKFRRIVGLTSF